MKTIIHLPENSTLIDIEEEFLNRILSYDLFGNTLTVISTNCSDICPELFMLKLRTKYGIEEFIFTNTGYTQHSNSDTYIDFEMVG
jgi:hypothetical protein